jgi:hypothetical protein
MAGCHPLVPIAIGRTGMGIPISPQQNSNYIRHDIGGFRCPPEPLQNKLHSLRCRGVSPSNRPPVHSSLSIGGVSIISWAQQKKNHPRGVFMAGWHPLVPIEIGRTGMGIPTSPQQITFATISGGFSVPLNLFRTNYVRHDIGGFQCPPEPLQNKLRSPRYRGVSPSSRPPVHSSLSIGGVCIISWAQQKKITLGGSSWRGAILSFQSRLEGQGRAFQPLHNNTNYIRHDIGGFVPLPVAPQ